MYCTDCSNPIGMCECSSFGGRRSREAPTPASPLTPSADTVKTMFERYGLQEGLHGGWRRYTLTSFRLAVSSIATAGAADPLDTPLPCDVKVGATTFRKGVKLGTLVMAAQRWHRDANPDFYSLTDKEKAANLARLQSCAAALPDTGAKNGN